MKKRLSFVILAILVFPGISSCSFIYGIIGDPIVGAWAVTAETINGDTIAVGPSGYQATMTIGNDNTITGSGTSTGTPFLITGEWSKSGSTYALFVTSVAGSNSVSVTMRGPLSFDGKTLDMDLSGQDISSGSVTLVKQ